MQGEKKKTVKYASKSVCVWERREDSKQASIRAQLRQKNTTKPWRTAEVQKGQRSREKKMKTGLVNEHNGQPMITKEQKSTDQQKYARQKRQQSSKKKYEPWTPAVSMLSALNKLGLRSWRQLVKSKHLERISSINAITSIMNKFQLGTERK